MGNNSNFNLIYEELIFEEIEYLESIITEENFLDVCKSILEKVKNFFSMSIQAFNKGCGYVVDFCKKVFQLSHVKTIMNSLGLSDEFLGKLVGAVIVIPVAKIGYDTVKNTYKDIRDQDVCMLIDRVKFNNECGKLFSQKNFWEKAWTIVKTYGKHYNKTNHGAMELDGVRTKFDTEAGKYTTEKCSPTEVLYNLQQEYGIPTLGGSVSGF